MPTIATSTASNQNIIENGFNGILTEDTPEEIAASVIELLDNPRQRKKLSQNARNSVIQFDYKTITLKQLIPMYNQLLDI